METTESPGRTDETLRGRPRHRPRSGPGVPGGTERDGNGTHPGRGGNRQRTDVTFKSLPSLPQDNSIRGSRPGPQSGPSATTWTENKRWTKRDLETETPEDGEGEEIGRGIDRDGDGVLRKTGATEKKRQ